MACMIQGCVRVCEIILRLDWNFLNEVSRRDKMHVI